MSRKDDEISSAVSMLIEHARKRCAEQGQELRVCNIQRWSFGLESFMGEVTLTIKLDGAELYK